MESPRWGGRRPPPLEIRRPGAEGSLHFCSCMKMYVYLPVYALYIYIYIYICICLSLSLYICVYKTIFVYMCIYVRAYMRMHAHMYTRYHHSHPYPCTTPPYAVFRGHRAVTIAIGPELHSDWFPTHGVVCDWFLECGMAGERSSSLS